MNAPAPARTYPPRDPPFPQPGRWFVSIAPAGRWISRPGQPIYIPSGSFVCDAQGSVTPASEYRQMMPGDRLAEGGIRSIALIRNGELGDVIACGAALKLVRTAYPEVEELAVYCHSQYAAALQKWDGVAFLPGQPREHPARMIVNFDLLLEFDHAAPEEPKCIRASRLEKVASVFNLYCDPAAII